MSPASFVPQLLLAVQLLLANSCALPVLGSHLAASTHVSGQLPAEHLWRSTSGAARLNVAEDIDQDPAALSPRRRRQLVGGVIYEAPIAGSGVRESTSSTRQQAGGGGSTFRQQQPAAAGREANGDRSGSQQQRQEEGVFSALKSSGRGQQEVGKQSTLTGGVSAIKSKPTVTENGILSWPESFSGQTQVRIKKTATGADVAVLVESKGESSVEYRPIEAVAVILPESPAMKWYREQQQTSGAGSGGGRGGGVPKLPVPPKDLVGRVQSSDLGNIYFPGGYPMKTETFSMKTTESRFLGPSHSLYQSVLSLLPERLAMSPSGGSVRVACDPAGGTVTSTEEVAYPGLMTPSTHRTVIDVVRAKYPANSQAAPQIEALKPPFPQPIQSTGAGAEPSGQLFLRLREFSDGVEGEPLIVSLPSGSSSSSSTSSSVGRASAALSTAAGALSPRSKSSSKSSSPASASTEDTAQGFFLMMRESGASYLEFVTTSEFGRGPLVGQTVERTMNIVHRDPEVMGMHYPMQLTDGQAIGFREGRVFVTVKIGPKEKDVLEVPVVLFDGKKAITSGGLVEAIFSGVDSGATNLKAAVTGEASASRGRSGAQKLIAGLRGVFSSKNAES